MSQLYHSRKEQLISDKKTFVGNIDTEIEKVRSQSPKPPARECLIDPSKKIAYKIDIEDLKKKVDKFEANTKAIETNLSLSFVDLKNEISSVVESKMSEQQKYFDSMKIENLKNALNTSIKEINENLKNIACQLVAYKDEINILKSKISEIENLF
jgi:hypothetical protein